MGPSDDPDDIGSVPVPPRTEDFRSELAREKRVTFNRVFRTPIRKSDNPSFFDRTEFNHNKKTGNLGNISYKGKRIFNITGGKNRSRYANESIELKNLVQVFNSEFDTAKSKYEKSESKNVEDTASTPLTQETVDDVNRNVIDELESRNTQEDFGEDDIRLLAGVVRNDEDINETISRMDNEDDITQFLTTSLSGIETQAEDSSES